MIFQCQLWQSLQLFGHFFEEGQLLLEVTDDNLADLCAFVQHHQLQLIQSNISTIMTSIFKAMSILLLLCILASQKEASVFPKILWVYWQQGFQSAPVFTQLSIKNKQKYAAKSGWEMRFLTGKNMHEYINPQEIQEIMVNAEDKLVQLKADILRMKLLYAYGGMWMDANSVFLRDLNWIDSIDTDNTIKNKISADPELLMGAYTTYSHGGNITYVFDETTHQQINVFPGLQNWFIVAKPHSRFLKEALQRLPQILKVKKEEMDKKILSEGIILSKEHLDPYLIGSDYLFQILLQSKQKQLDKQKSYAVDYYKIWHLQADENVFKYTIYTRFKRYQMWADLINYSTEQLSQVIGEAPYFWKFVGWQHPEFSLFLSNYDSFNCWGGDLLIQKESSISKYMLEDANSSVTNMIDLLNQKSNDKEFCVQRMDEKYKQTNRQGLTYYTVHLLFVLSILCVLVCTKCIGFFCENTLNFKDLPFTYR